MNTENPSKPRKRRPGRYGVALPHLKAWREYKVLSPGMLAKAAGITSTSITNYEHNRFNAKAENVHKLAKALGISPEQLVYEEPPIKVAQGA